MANFFLDNKDLQFHMNHPLMKKIVELKEKGYADKDAYDYAPVDFEDAQDSYRRVMEIVGEVCGDVIAPNAEGVDHDGPKVVNDHVEYAPGTARNIEALRQAGLFGLTLPRKYEGLNFPLVYFVMANEMVARADAGFENIWGLQDCAETLNEFASEELKAKYLPRVSRGETCAMDLTEPDAGSDLQAVMLKAHWDEAKGTWLLNGVKRFITNGDGHISLVLARSEEGTTDARGLSMFVYDRSHMAVKVRRIENKLGIKGSPTCELVFTNAPAELVGDRKMGLIKYVMSLMNAARLGIGAQSTGLSEAAYREALKYAQERMQFGKPIIEFPAVAEMLSNMKAKLYGSRAMLYETTRFVEIYKDYTHLSHDRKLTPEERAEMKTYTRLADAFTPMLKLMSSEYCNQLAYDAIQVFGGSGYMKDYPIERIYRDARITNIYEGTSQLQVVAAIRHYGHLPESNPRVRGADLRGRFGPCAPEADRDARAVRACRREGDRRGEQRVHRLPCPSDGRDGRSYHHRLPVVASGERGRGIPCLRPALRQARGGSERRRRRIHRPVVARRSGPDYRRPAGRIV